MRLYVQRIEADPVYHAMLGKALAKAWEEVQQGISDLNRIKEAA
jgi:hypothetical protein